MGRREQKERERKRAAASCQMLERFLSKKSKTGEVSSELNDSSVQNEMQPSLQTTPATDTSPPSTSQESVCNDYDVCQHEETSKVDIGEIFYKAKTPKKFSYAIKTLTMSQKYHLLTIPKGQLKEKTFPTQYLAGCNRSFRLEWLSQHPWMMYSERLDGVFCTACAIFLLRCIKKQVCHQTISKVEQKK